MRIPRRVFVSWETKFLMIQKPSVRNRTKGYIFAFYHLLQHTPDAVRPFICAPITAEPRHPLLLSHLIHQHTVCCFIHISISESHGFQRLRLGSDLQKCPTRTRLASSPARCGFRILPTVFVNAFLLKTYTRILYVETRN